MAACNYIEGSEIELVSDDGVYIGILCRSSGDKITLEKVKSKATGKQLSGLLHFYSREIIKVTLIEEKCQEVAKDDRGGPRLCHKKQTPTHIEKFRTALPKQTRHSTATLTSLEHAPGNNSLLPRAQSFPVRKDMTSSCFGTSNSVMSVADDLTKVTRDGRREIHMPLSYSIICELGEHFMAVIDHLQHQSIVGLAVEGVDIGRYGHLCWLQVGTWEHVFLFDMIALGGACFHQGLADILSNHTLQKVVHDCRKISDMLWHQYQVQMVNVFDTQVADMNVYQLQHQGDLPYYTKNLSACLFEHLNLTTEQVFIYKIRENSLKEDQSKWMMRPASEVILDAAVKNVAFLLELRIALLEKMLSRFVDGVDVYLSVIRDASKEQFDEGHSTQSHLIPKEFTHLKTEAVRCRDLSQQIATSKCVGRATSQQTNELPKYQLEPRRRGYATTRHHDDTVVDNAVVTQQEPTALEGSVNQITPLMTDNLINMPGRTYPLDNIPSASATVTGESIFVDTSRSPMSATNTTLHSVNKLVLTAEGHEASLSQAPEPDLVSIPTGWSRRRGADSCYSTGSSDDTDEYNMIPSHNMIRSSASSEPCVANRPISHGLAVVDSAPTPKRCISGSNKKTPKGVNPQGTTMPSRLGVGVGRATALHACLQKLSLSPDEARSIRSLATLMSPPSRCALGQFRDVNSDASTDDVLVYRHQPDTDFGSGQVYIQGKSGLGRSAILARHAT